MPRNALHVCFYLCLLVSYVFAANILDNHLTIHHDDANVKYSAVAAGLGHGDCTRVPSPCDNKWWIQPNEGGNAAQFATTHTTAKGSASLTFTFSGSRAISIVGKRDSSVNAQVTLNGQSYQMTTANEPELFRNEGLSAGTTYTLRLTYGGQGFLSIAALYIESSGRPGAPTSNPPPPPVQTTPKPPQQPPPPTSQQPPPTQSSKPTPTQTQPPGAGGGADNPTSSPGSSPGETTPPPNAPTDTPPNDPDPSDPDAPPSDSSSGKPGSGAGGTSTTPESANAPTGGRPQSPNETTGGGGGDLTDPAAAPTSTEGAGRPRNHHDNSALIGGIVSGVLVFLLLLGLAAWYLRRWIRARRAPSYAYRNGPGKFDVAPFTAGAVAAEPLPSNWQGFHDEGAAGPEMAERPPLERQQTAESRMGIAV
ncbi:hypothetical protein AURDEDRAFT_188904 [Auricularia subglabra TFB-10046 SS5]|uniref:Mid2 domain-containing protein n=1 Tax=Auricularia subglabra (strain TFB-10046 / SS5) TaxID=717982 RepID=J0D7A5_AURST|nr:hypothetical protein AURDEDRAFT_188904 [Auricularia subglabra TFB-10046 SS5]